MNMPHDGSLVLRHNLERWVYERKRERLHRNARARILGVLCVRRAFTETDVEDQIDGWDRR
jgi:hypothetical protein